LLLNYFFSHNSAHLLFRASRIADPLTTTDILDLTGNMTGLPINALASSHMEDSIQAAEVPQPSNIKIRFKKGAIFAKLGDESAAVDIMVSQLPIRLSPESEKKRKAAQGTGFENDEHHVSDLSSPCKIWISERSKRTLANPLFR
jgi:hypothetical protein